MGSVHKLERAMPSENGYVNLWRDINKQSWASDALMYGLFTRLLTMVQHQAYTVDYKGISVALQPGEYVTDYATLADMFAQIRDKRHARQLIEKFVKLGQMQTREIKKNNRFCGLIIGFSGWKKWQNLSTPTGTPTGTPKAPNLKALDGGISTPTGTQFGTHINNNGLNNNKDLVSKDTCQNSGEFSPEKPKIQKTPIKEIVQLFGEILPSLPQPKKITPARQKSLRARHVNDLKSDIDNWRKYFTYIRDNCSWMLSGEYNIDFDYVIRSANFQKIAEGARNDKR